MGRLKTNAEFIEEANEVHGYKYDYSETVYKGDGEKVYVICHEKDIDGKEHGGFWQNAGSHLRGNGCPSCAGLKPLTTEEFIKRSRQKHGNKYDYSHSVYVNKRTKVKIICPIHGEFMQYPANHYNGEGCPKCGKKYAQEYRKGNYHRVIELSKERFGDAYEFPNIEDEFENFHSVITIKCKKCGKVFTKIACDHVTSTNGGCLNCRSKETYSKSQAESEILQYLKNILPDEYIVTNDRTFLNGMELDIFIPYKNIAIEYDGLYWHSDKVKYNKHYHLMKTEACEYKGVHLIHIFEDEYQERKELVLKKLSYILGASKLQTIMARKCSVREISNKIAKDFLNKNHIQGFSPSSVYTGAYYNDTLISVMSFKLLVKGGDEWELTRFASDNGYKCIGVGGKLLKFFERKYGPKEIKSFADRRWSTILNGNLYDKLGFRFEKYTLPSYSYVVGGKRYHKFGFRKKRICKKYDLPMSMTEKEMTDYLGFAKIYDSGLIKYVWTK